MKSTWRWGGLLLIALLAAFILVRRRPGPALRDDAALSVAGGRTTAITPATAPGMANTNRLRRVPGEKVRSLPRPPVAFPAGNRDETSVPPQAVAQTPGVSRAGSRVEGGPFEASREWISELRAHIAGEPSQALAYCLSLPADRQMTACYLLFTNWVRSDPEAAFAAAMGLADNLRQAMVMNTLNLWASHNPEAALVRLASADELPANVRTQIELRAISAIGMRDPVAAMDLLAATEVEDAATESRITGELLGRWITMDTTTALSWLKDSELDDATYDRAIMTAVQQMMWARGEDAVALFEEFVGSGRMDYITDPEVYAQTVWAAKSLGVTRGSRDYSGALAWALGLPTDSAAQAYVLSNVAFSQVHGKTLPDMPWIAEMNPGFARVRVIAAVAYGRLLANGQRDLGAEVKQQLDADEYRPERLKDIVEQGLPADEKQVLRSWL